MIKQIAAQMAICLLAWQKGIVMNNNGLKAIVLLINHAMDIVQITTHGANYTCPTKMINGELHFKFKNSWHSVAAYSNEFTRTFGNIRPK